MSVSAGLARRPLLVLILVGLACRLVTLGDPVIHVDEEFYVAVGTALRHGALPFVDVWDRKPVGLFLLYALPASLGFPAGIWAYQLMALASAVATARLIVAFARRAGFAPGALAGGVAYLLWLDLLGGQGGQAPVFYNLPMAAAAWLIAGGGRGRSVAAMALVGLALQIKYSVVFEGVFLGLWALAAEWRRTGRVAATLAHGALLVAVALAPTAAVALFYAWAGQWPAFAFANFVSIFARHVNDRAEMIGNAAQLALVVSPVVAMAVAGARAVATPPARFVRAWFIAALIGVLLFPPWFDHYGLPLLVPGCILAAGFLGAGRRWVAPILVAAAVGGQALVIGHLVGRGGWHQFARLATAVGEGPGCLYVYSGSTMLYVATHRCALSRYLAPAQLGRTREAGAVGVDQQAEIARIFARRPAVVVMRPLYRGERPEAHALALARVRRDYVRTAVLPMGDERVSVWKRRQSLPCSD